MAYSNSHLAISHPYEYDPYAYPCAYHSPACNVYDYPCSSTAPPSSTYRRSRADSVWSTFSVCSDASSVGLLLDDGEHDFDEDESIASPISLAESSSSRTSWSSMASSSSTASNGSALVHDRSGRYKRSSMAKPRGPRPLPALPTSQPPSPYSATSTLPPTLPLKVTPPLRLNLKILTPPPSYEEAMSASTQTSSSEPSPESQYERRPRSFPGPFPFDAETEVDASPVEFLTSPSEETIIDWQRIEEFMARCDG